MISLTPATVSSPISYLPEEILLEVFLHLNPKETAASSLVCQKWEKVAQEPTLWKFYFMRNNISQTRYANPLRINWKKAFIESELEKTTIQFQHLTEEKIKICDLIRKEIKKISCFSCSRFGEEYIELFVRNPKKIRRITLADEKDIATSNRIIELEKKKQTLTETILNMWKQINSNENHLKHFYSLFGSEEHYLALPILKKTVVSGDEISFDDLREPVMRGEKQPLLAVKILKNEHEKFLLLFFKHLSSGRWSMVPPLSYQSVKIHKICGPVFFLPGEYNFLKKLLCDGIVIIEKPESIVYRVYDKG